MKKIYLAGGWSDWRDVVMTTFTNAIYLNPRIVTDKKDWFELETNMIRECDAVIAWITKDNPSGFGTTFEMGFSYGLKKPYIFINEMGEDYKYNMQTKGAVKTFYSWEDAEKWIIVTNWMDLQGEFNPKKSLISRYATKPINENYYGTIKVENIDTDVTQKDIDISRSEICKIGTVKILDMDEIPVFNIPEDQVEGIVYKPKYQDPNTGKIVYWNNKFGEDATLTYEDGSQYIAHHTPYIVGFITTKRKTIEEFIEHELKIVTEHAIERLKLYNK